MGTALKHFLERAAGDHLGSFDLWFPGCFDWRALCADVPAMLEASGLPVPATEGDTTDLVTTAGAVFRAGHLFTLVVLAAAAEGQRDPQEVLDHLTGRLDEDEEAHFEESAATVLGDVEELLLEGDDAAAGAVAHRAADLVRASWPAVEHLLGSDEGRLFERSGEAASILWSVARVGAILAALRWIAADALVEDWPALALDDPGD